MTNSDLILKLIEMLLAERDKNNNLQSKLEENKKVKAKKSLHSRCRKVLQVLSCFFVFYIKKVCVLQVHIQANK